MTIAFWTGNGQNRAGVVMLQVTAVAVGGTLTATINGKDVTYTCITGDTVQTAASAWQALLANQTVAPPEFAEIVWTVSGDTITATAAVPGVPFFGMTGGLTSAGGGGATVTQTTVTTSLSQSDVGLAANWLRSGVAALPQNADDVIIGDSTIPLLYNLTALAAVQFGSYTRYQSFSGAIGLNENNPNGYREYRPTYFQFSGPPAGTLILQLGVGPDGNGPTRERYDVGSQRSTITLLASGSPTDTYAVLFLGSNANNTFTVVGTSLGIATLPGETATIASGNVDGAGFLALGPGCTFSGNLLLNASGASVACAPAAIVADYGTLLTVSSKALTYTAVTAKTGSTVVWLSDSTITTLVLQGASLLDKGQDLQAMTVTNSTIDGDCVINDPYNRITFTNATTINTVIQSGPFLIGSGRTIKVT